MSDIHVTDKALLDVLVDACGQSTYCLTCACGRTHFNSEFQADEGDGVEELRAKAQKDPDQFVEHDCSISVVGIGREDLVIDCHCHKALAYARLFWSYRFLITRIFELCADKIASYQDGAQEAADKARRAVGQKQ